MAKAVTTRFYYLYFPHLVFTHFQAVTNLPNVFRERRITNIMNTFFSIYFNNI